MRQILFPRVTKSNVGYIKRVLEPLSNRFIIDDCFTWATTEQGHEYWRGIYEHERDLSDKDRLYLQVLTKISEGCKIWASPEAEKLLLP